MYKGTQVHHTSFFEEFTELTLRIRHCFDVKLIYIYFHVQRSVYIIWGGEKCGIINQVVG